MNKLLSLIDQAVFAATAFLTTVIVGRALSAAELGIYYLAFTIVMLMRGVQAELTSSPYTVYSQRRAGHDLATYAGSTLAFHGLLTGVGAMCLAAVGLAEWLGGRGDLLSLCLMVAAVLPFLLVREYIRRFCFAHFEVGAATVLDLATAFLQLGGLWVLAQLGWLTVTATYGVMGLACAAVSAVWFVRRAGMFAFDRTVWRRDWRHNWQFSQWTVAGFALGSTAPLALPWLLAAVHGESAAGFLAACQTLVGVSNMFVTGISNVLTPQAARAFATGGVTALWRVLLKTAALYTVGLGALSLLFVIAGEPLLSLVFAGEYAGAGPVLTLLSLSVVAQGLTVTAGNGLWAIEKPKTNLVADVCALAIAAATAMCVVAPLGVVGVAITLLAWSICGAVVRWSLLWIELSAAERQAVAA